MISTELPDKPLLSIVLPSYNEERRIGNSLLTIADFLKKQNFEYEVLISDDGSTDRTNLIVKMMMQNWKQLRIIPNAHKGKGPALIAGASSARGKYILFSDVDLSVSINQVTNFLMDLEKSNADIAIATREGKKAKRINEPFTRHLMGRVFNVLVNCVLFLGIDDTQCGFKLFKAEVAHDIFRRTTLYSERDPVIKGGRVGAFDVEFLFLAKKLNYKIIETPVTWTYADNSKVHNLKDPYYNAKDVLLVRLNSLRGLYDLT